jgi:hypothetical protein
VRNDWLDGVALWKVVSSNSARKEEAVKLIGPPSEVSTLVHAVYLKLPWGLENVTFVKDTMATGKLYSFLLISFSCDRHSRTSRLTANAAATAFGATVVEINRHERNRTAPDDGTVGVARSLV